MFITELIKVCVKVKMKCSYLLLLLFISCQGQSIVGVNNIENIKTFARLYGYARWFHPSDETQEIDWDKFAILGIQKIENIKSTKELRDTLFTLFSPIVQGLQIYEVDSPEQFDPDVLLSDALEMKPIAWQHHGVYLDKRANIYKSVRTNKKNEVYNRKSDLFKVSQINYTGSMFDCIPQFGEIIKESIGNNLICVVPITLLTDGFSTYPKTEISLFSRLKSELDNIEINDGFNTLVNLASIVIFWNVFQHFFPYFDVIDTDWEKALGETLESTLENKRKKDFFITLSQMLAKINDGHGMVYGEQMFHLPIRTEFIENQIVITASNIHTLEKGDIIKKIDGKPVMESLDETEKIISGSPQLRRYRALNILGSKFDPGITLLVIERGGMEQSILVSNTGSSKSVFFNNIDERTYLRDKIIEIEFGIFYVNMSNCTKSDFDEKIDVLANAKAVIYDQRGVQRLTFRDIVPYFVENSVTSTWWNIPETVYPNRKEVEFDKYNWSIQPSQPFFKSKAIIINDPFVVSGGETMMDIIDHYNLATTVGELTAGCNGNVNYINLPCGYNVMWTGMKVLKHDGSQLYLKGFQADYPINKTIQAVREGRDEYLEKALEIAKKIY